MCTEFWRARLPKLGPSFALLLLSRNTTRAFLTHLSSFSPPPSGRVILCGPFAHYLRFCSSEALGKVRLFASFILIVRSFSIGHRKTSPRPASTREYAASNPVPFVVIARDQQFIICLNTVLQPSARPCVPGAVDVCFDSVYHQATSCWSPLTFDSARSTLY
jgi:hypothetical protein